MEPFIISRNYGTLLYTGCPTSHQTFIYWVSHIISDYFYILGVPNHIRLFKYWMSHIISDYFIYWVSHIISDYLNILSVPHHIRLVLYTGCPTSQQTTLIYWVSNIISDYLCILGVPHHIILEFRSCICSFKMIYLRLNKILKDSVI